MNKSTLLILVMSMMMTMIVIPSALATTFPGCGTSLGSDTYTLNTNLVATSGCIFPQADNIVFDCAGYQIDMSNSNELVSVFQVIDNFELKNCEVINGADSIIKFSTAATNFKLTNNEITALGRIIDNNLMNTEIILNNNVFNNTGTLSNLAIDFQTNQGQNSQLTMNANNVYGGVYVEYGNVNVSNNNFYDNSQLNSALRFNAELGFWNNNNFYNNFDSQGGISAIQYPSKYYNNNFYNNPYFVSDAFSDLGSVLLDNELDTGNYWDVFSPTCNDGDSNGRCDDFYDAGGIADNYPLTSPAVVDQASPPTLIDCAWLSSVEANSEMFAGGNYYLAADVSPVSCGLAMESIHLTSGDLYIEGNGYLFDFNMDVFDASTTSVVNLQNFYSDLTTGRGSIDLNVNSADVIATNLDVLSFSITTTGTVNVSDGSAYNGLTVDAYGGEVKNFESNLTSTILNHDSFVVHNFTTYSNQGQITLNSYGGVLEAYDLHITDNLQLALMDLFVSGTGVINLHDSEFARMVVYNQPSLTGEINVYNNFINTSSEVDYFSNPFGRDLSMFNFNISQQAGTTIKGYGASIGGNYWALSDGTGYSETCSGNVDGFCDISYSFETGLTDYLPLAKTESVQGIGDVSDCRVINQSGNYTLVNDLISNSSICLNISADDVVVNFNNFKINNSNSATAIYADSVDNLTLNDVIINKLAAGGYAINFNNINGTINTLNITGTSTITKQVDNSKLTINNYNDMGSLTERDAFNAGTSELNVEGGTIYCTSLNVGSNSIINNTVQNCNYFDTPMTVSGTNINILNNWARTDQQQIISLASSSTGLIVDNNTFLSKNGGTEFVIRSNGYNYFRQVTFTNNNVSTGFNYLFYSTYSNTYVGDSMMYNNYLSNTAISSSLQQEFKYNTTQQAGTPIDGNGTLIGGNYWVGYSDNTGLCFDVDQNGFCDSPYVNGGITDYLPLTNNPFISNPPVITANSPFNYDNLPSSDLTIGVNSAYNISWCAVKIDGVLVANETNVPDLSGEHVFDSIVTTAYLTTLADDGLDHVMTAKCENVYGEESNEPNSVNFTVYSTNAAPVVTLDAPNDNQVIPDSGQAFTITVTDDHTQSGMTCDLYVDDSQEASLYSVNNGSTLSFNQGTIDTLLGTLNKSNSHEAYVACYDSFNEGGNSSINTFLFTQTKITNESCPLITYPNEANLPAVAELSVTFDLYGANGFSGATVNTNLTYGGNIRNSACTYTTIDSQNREYTCNVSLNYWYDAGQYDLDISANVNSYSDSVSQNNYCEVGQLIASQRVTPSVGFSDAAPGISDSIADNALKIKNTGNVPLDIKLTAYDLKGRSEPNTKLFASYFKTGASLGTSVALEHGVQKSTGITITNAENSESDVWLWLSMPSNQMLQDYYAATPWQVIGSAN